MHRLYKTHLQITQWLERHGIHNYTLTPDPVYGFTVDVQDNVNLSDQALKKILVKFGRVNGDFMCSHNQLTTLFGAPDRIEGIFDCRANRLTSLDFSPLVVEDHFVCDHNFLTTLKGCTQNLKNNFSCSHNRITSLEFGPAEADCYWCDYNCLTSLEFAPQKVQARFRCNNNQLIDLEFCPQSVGGHFNCQNNPMLADAQNIDSFQEIFKIHKEIVRIKNERQQLSLSIHGNDAAKKSHKI